MAAPGYPVSAGGAELEEAAALAEGECAARLFGVAVQQGMVFVEQPDVRWEVGVEEGLEALVGVPVWCHAEPLKDPPGIGVDDE